RGRRSSRSFAGNSVVIPIEATVVRHGEGVERAAALEGGDGLPRGLISRLGLTNAVRVLGVQCCAVLIETRNGRAGSARNRESEHGDARQLEHLRDATRAGLVAKNWPT